MNTERSLPSLGYTSCLVTGATGFIGSALCRRLSQSGVHTYRLVHQDPEPGDIVVQLGRQPVPSLRDICPEVIFHTAGIAHDPRVIDNAALQVSVSVDGTRSLLEAAADANVKALVFLSTCAVMGEGSATPLTEEDRPLPRTAYGRAKLEAERIILAANRRSRLQTTCLRLPLVYGRGHKGNLPRMIDAIARGRFPPLPEYGGRRSMVHVEDVIDAALLASLAPNAAGRVFFVTEPRAYSSRELYEILLRAMGKPVPSWHVPKAALTAMAGLGDAVARLTRRRVFFDSMALAKLSESAVYSSERIRLELGFQAQRTFAESAKELLRPTRG